MICQGVAGAESSFAEAAVAVLGSGFGFGPDFEPDSKLGSLKI